MEIVAGESALFRGAPPGLVCELPRGEIGYAQLFLLHAFRDGEAEVDHIHLEGKLETGTAFDLTLLCAREPRKLPAAAAKILGRKPR